MRAERVSDRTRVGAAGDHPGLRDGAPPMASMTESTVERTREEASSFLFFLFLIGLTFVV